MRSHRSRLTCRLLTTTLLLVAAGAIREPSAAAGEETARPSGHDGIESEGAGASGVEEDECPEELGPPTTAADARSGSLLLATTVPGVYLPAPSVASRFTVTVSGLLARTRLVQSFRNPTGDWVEGIYVFPLPVGAVVDTLHLQVGERLIEGEIHERGEARRIYQEARAAGQRTALLEQERPNLFTTSVANLGPDETLEVTIEYQELLRLEVREGRGRIELRLPLTVTPRYWPAAPLTADRTPAADAGPPGPPAEPTRDPAYAAAGKGPKVSIEVDLRPGFPLAELGSPSHAIRQRTVQGSHRRLVSLAAAGPGGGDAGVPRVGDRDFVLVWEPRTNALPQASLLTGERAGETYAVLTILPPIAPADPLRRLPREVILIIDTSGSMDGTSIEQARASVAWALDHLSPPDRFNLIRYSDDATALFPASALATPEALSEAREWVRDLRAGGGTETATALRLALEAPPDPSAVVRQVVLATDGAVGNETELFAWLERNLGDSRLFTVGIGSAPNARFMTGAAAAGRGTFTFIGRPSEIGGAMSTLFERLSRPAVAQLEVQWDDAAADSWPRVLPEVYAGEPLVVAARLPHGRIGVRLTGRLGDGPWDLRLDGEPGIARSGIDRLWAGRAIAGLLDELLRGREPALVREDVLGLALDFGVVSPYTSLVAVDRTPAAPGTTPPVPRRIPLALPAGWQGGGSGGGLPQTASPATRDLLRGLALLALAAILSHVIRSPRRHRAGSTRRFPAGHQQAAATATAGSGR